MIGRGETDPSQFPGGERTRAAPAARVIFDRYELGRILSLYGRMVVVGEWRDYAIDYLKDRAVFSVFRHACEVPIYRIEKNVVATPGVLQRNLGDRAYRAPRARA